jgi:transglutaminase-like putative cysteine protease
MWIRISHQTTYRYDPPTTGVIQTLRLTPRGHDGQYVVRWRIDISEDCRLYEHEDAFGNITHNFTLDGPCKTLRLQVDGEVETQDTAGVVRDAVERFPPTLFLRETPLALADTAIKDFAETVRQGAGADTLTLLHTLMGQLKQEMAFDTDPTNTGTTAAEAFALRRGVCQDMAHVFIAGCRSLGVPARYVSGYLRRSDGVVDQEAGHAWAEAFVPDLGWVAFDPTNGICATDSHVRVAIGLDYLGAAPVRGSRTGGGRETLKVAIHVDQVQQQEQS